MDKYISNPISKSIDFGGFEPFDSFEDMLELIAAFRSSTNDDIVIYTGYEPSEKQEELKKIAVYNNIIIKFGRYIPNRSKRFDDILGIYLASDNQYAVKLEEFK